MSYTLNFAFNLGVGQIGLTLNGQLYDSAGATTGALITTGFVEIGNGLYTRLCTIPDGHVGVLVVFDSANAAVFAAAAINPQTAENLDVKVSLIKAKTDLISNGTVIVIVPGGITGSAITVRRGDTTTININGLGSLAGRTNLYFTVKTDTGQPDSTSIIQITESAGLLFLNGGVAGTPGDGSLVVSNAVLGDIVISLDANLTKDLAPGITAVYDIEIVQTAIVTTLLQGQFNVDADVTRAIT